MDESAKRHHQRTVALDYWRRANQPLMDAPVDMDGQVTIQEVGVVELWGLINKLEEAHNEIAELRGYPAARLGEAR